jgi:PKD repeat protein
MKLRIILLSLFIVPFTLNNLAQNKTGNTPSHNEEIPYYYKDGVKLSKKNNTPLILSNINDPVQGNTPSEMALDWITSKQELLKIEKLTDLKVRFKRSSLSGHTIRFEQLLNNIPVYNSEIVVHISPNKTVTYVTNTFDPSVQNISTTPSLSKEAAFLAAKEKIKAKGKIQFTSNKLLIYNNLENTVLVYKVIIEPEYPIGSWEVLVNAQTGEIIRAINKAYNFKTAFLPPPPPPVNGTGNVFLSDPLSFANATYGGNYSDNNDATNAQLDAAMASVTLLDIDNTGGTYTLKGPYAEVMDFESPYNGLFTQATSTFNFNRFDDAFEAVNCYYIIDQSMRYINLTLGIPLMPYQYSTGVRYDPHGLGGADNSHYMGGSGRLAFGEGGVDDAEDADVIVHELGHGIHDWVTGGSSSQVNGLGEGSGDYWGQSYSRSLGEWTSSAPEYQWFFSWDGHNPFWNGRITNYTATYPGGLTGAIHTDGQIWATCLMRIYDIIGREKVDKAFLEGLGMTGSSTNQQDAAIAVRQAAIDMGYSCPDIDVFTQEFTATGYNMPALNPISPAPVVADTTQCDGPVAIINGNVYSLHWYDDFGLTNLLSTSNNLTTGQSTAGTYTYYVKYDHAVCSAAPSDTVILTITSCAAVPVANFSATDTSICIGDCIDFNDLSTGTPTNWTWYFFGSSTPTSSVQNPTNICYTAFGSFDVALVVSNANGSDSLYLSNYINVTPPIIVDAGVDATICSGMNANISAIATGGTSPYTYTWNNGLGAGQNHTVTPTVTTTYLVTCMGSGTCPPAIDSVTVFVNPLPNITMSNDTVICQNDSTTISFSVTGGTMATHVWDNGLGMGLSHMVGPLNTTTYTVTVLDINGCQNTDSVTITVVLCSGINENNTDAIFQVYPNPTAEELNVVIGNLNKNMEITLFDNLGRIVYQMVPTSTKSVINLSKFSKGIYTLSLNTGSNIITKKIIKE